MIKPSVCVCVCFSFALGCQVLAPLLIFILFSFSPENKLQQKSQINLQNKKKKSHQKKITGFQVFYWISDCGFNGMLQREKKVLLFSSLREESIALWSVYFWDTNVCAPCL